MNYNIEEMIFFEKDIPPDGSKHFHGAEVTIFKAISQALNFGYTIQEPQICCGFGSISSGVTGEMAMGLSDVAWSQLYFNEWRWHRFDVTTSYDEEQACFMVNCNSVICRYFHII